MDRTDLSDGAESLPDVVRKVGDSALSPTGWTRAVVTYFDRGMVTGHVVIPRVESTGEGDLPDHVA